MRRPTILDVMSAVKRAAIAHPEVSAWWYLPERRLRLEGDVTGRGEDAPADVEVVYSTATSAAVDEANVARELAAAMRIPRVRVRAHRGAAETVRLFRIVSCAPDAAAATPEGASDEQGEREVGA